MAKYLIPFFLFAVMVSLLMWGLGSERGDKTLIPSPFIGKPAPNLALDRLDEPKLKFSNQELIGKISLVNFWASWCPTCEYEHPFFKQLSKMPSIQLIGVSYKDARADGLRWLQRHGNPYDAIPYDGSGRVGIDWGIVATPETFVVDQKGVVRYKHTGAINGQVLADVILPLVKKLQQESAQ